MKMLSVGLAAALVAGLAVSAAPTSADAGSVTVTTRNFSFSLGHPGGRYYGHHPRRVYRHAPRFYGHHPRRVLRHHRRGHAYYGHPRYYGYGHVINPATGRYFGQGSDPNK